MIFYSFMVRTLLCKEGESQTSRKESQVSTVLDGACF